ncbi:hypothetical protein HHI36_009179 [Cryptolaemus montrouzieri]|uniref:Uncharacterized protein n=1 Tax=Cryptolaemus montrouzieri TaxID=559131 RepID=A0ABD2MUS9_9CUCU
MGKRACRRRHQAIVALHLRNLASIESNATMDKNAATSVGDAKFPEMSYSWLLKIDNPATLDAELPTTVIVIKGSTTSEAAEGSRSLLDAIEPSMENNLCGSGVAAQLANYIISLKSSNCSSEDRQRITTSTRLSMSQGLKDITVREQAIMFLNQGLEQTTAEDSQSMVIEEQKKLLKSKIPETVEDVMGK